MVSGSVTNKQFVAQRVRVMDARTGCTTYIKTVQWQRKLSSRDFMTYQLLYNEVRCWQALGWAITCGATCCSRVEHIAYWYCCKRKPTYWNYSALQSAAESYATPRCDHAPRTLWDHNKKASGWTRNGSPSNCSLRHSYTPRNWRRRITSSSGMELQNELLGACTHILGSCFLKLM